MKRIIHVIPPLMLALLAACKQPDNNAYAPPPPPVVTVAQPTEQTVTEYLEFTGTTEAYEKVDVRARVSGFLEAVKAKPGTTVQAGDLLFVIDPAQYQAELNAANADLSGAEAQLRQAGIELNRVERLAKKKAVTDVEVVKWRVEKSVAEAGVARSKAKIEQAELNLGYTQVTAPIAGRVGRNLVDAGNLVGEGEATLLANITRYDPIYVYFNLNERDLLRAMEVYRDRLATENVDPARDGGQALQIPLEFALAGDEGYPHKGILDYADSAVNSNTGTIQMRGVVGNAEDPPKLIPGLFAHGRMPLRQRKNALLVSERAIGADQGGRYLLIANADNTVEKRHITQGQLIDGLRVIEDGVTAADWIVVKGIQKARPGAKVQPERADMNSLRRSAPKIQHQAAPPAGEPSQQR